MPSSGFSEGGFQSATPRMQSATEGQDPCPFEQLPATFRDAVGVSLRLDVHYLWIDSLCIVPDDEVGWVLFAKEIYRF